MRILLVEDDPLLGHSIVQGLSRAGEVVDLVTDGLAADAILRSSESFDVVVLDIGLPGQSGLEVLRNMRMRNDKKPVLVLTARDSVDDRINGLDSGADDYFPKPFDMEELHARLRALQRRTNLRAVSEIRYGKIKIDPASHTVWIDEELVPIARREFALLQKLLEMPGQVISREVLLQALYGWGEEIDSNALEVHVHNLRKRFGSQLIRTIRGVGYMVEKEQPESASNS